MESNKNNLKLIKSVDVKEAFKGKNPKMAKWLPGFIFRYIRKIVHEKDINDFLALHGEKTGLPFAREAIKKFNVKSVVIDEKNIPKTGRYIFAANHPLGGFDGILLMDILDMYYKNFKFVVNDLLMNITNLHPLFLPINKHGRQQSSFLKDIDDAFLSDTQIITFPSGFVSRRIKGQIVDLVWKKSFISQAVKYKRDIIPVFINGRNSEFFYKLGTIRRFLGIKANLEMFYLVDEVFKHENKTFTFTFGKPISYHTFDKSKKPMEWALWVKKKVYALNGVTSIPV